MGSVRSKGLFGRIKVKPYLTIARKKIKDKLNKIVGNMLRWDFDHYRHQQQRQRLLAEDEIQLVLVSTEAEATTASESSES